MKYLGRDLGTDNRKIAAVLELAGVRLDAKTPAYIKAGPLKLYFSVTEQLVAIFDNPMKTNNPLPWDSILDWARFLRASSGMDTYTMAAFLGVQYTTLAKRLQLEGMNLPAGRRKKT